MIKKYSLLALQTALNHALSLDETRAQKLNDLEGKVLQMIVSPLEVIFYLHFSKGKLYLLDHWEREPDTVIQSSPMGLIRLSLLPSSKVRSLFNDKIKLSGDLELGHKVKQLFEELDIDWEGHLAQFTGDVVAHQIGSMMRYGLNFTNRAKDTIKEQISEYLQEESSLFPPKEEVEDFFKDIDELTLTVERLEARINLIKNS